MDTAISLVRMCVSSESVPAYCAFGVNQGLVTWTDDMQQPDKTYAWKLFGGATEGLIHPWKGIPASSSPNTRLLDSRPTRIPSSPTAPPFTTPHSTFRPLTSYAKARGCCSVGGTAGYYRAPVRGRCQRAVTPAHGTPPARMYQGKCDGGGGGKNGY